MDDLDDITHPPAKNDWPILALTLWLASICAAVGFTLWPKTTGWVVLALVGLIAGLALYEAAMTRRRMKG